MATPAAAPGDATGTPILEAVPVRTSALVALPRLSHSSSSGGSSGRRFVTHTPSRRRAAPQDSDPCMLGASFDGWSDDDEAEETKTNEPIAAHPRPAVQRSHTENMNVVPPVPVAPLTIRVRKFASTSALDVRPSLAPAAITTNNGPEKEDAQDTQAAALEAGGVDTDNSDLLRAGRFEADTNATERRRSTVTMPEQAPRHWLCAWTRNPRFRRWYGRILNSYFAFWLVVCALVVALLELVLLLTVVMLRNNKSVMHGEWPRPHDAPPPPPDVPDQDRHVWYHQCHEFTRRGRFGPLHYLGAAACVTLALPVVFPIRVFTLYHVRADRRMVRRPYLHLCELFVTGEVAYLVAFVLTRGSHLPVVFTLACHRDLQPSEVTFLYATLLLWGVLWWQLVVFCRFLVHLKLQADAANDATHTSAVSDWFKFSNTRELAASKAHRPIQRFKKLLYRAAARGDTDAVDRLLTDQTLETFGIAGAADVRRLYATSPTLWLYAFAVSCKNPLHIAARRGHGAIVARLLALGFDANALDKVARVNFNLGLLFKMATRLLLKTQDGFSSPLRPLFCSVLLPPLHGAVAAGHVDVVRQLLEKGGADPNLLPRASFYHPSAVIPAIFLADDPEIVKLLVAKGANFLHVATTTLSGLASSTYATALQRSALTQRSATTEYLLSCGADVALTPLHAAAAADNTRTVKRLLRRRPHAQDDSVDARGERVEGVQRRTPLHWAAVVGRTAAATTLLHRGADPNARDRYGRTPLHWAARNNHASVVELLLDHGADATLEDYAHVPVLSFAAEADGVDVRVVAALLEHGASLKHGLPESGDTPLHIALQRENRETATSLIRCGADLMASNHDGKRAVDVTTSTKLQFELKKEAGTRDIMVSYPHSHFAFAQRVRSHLETHGKLTCWMDTMDPSGIGGGAVWREEIARGIHNCSLVVSIVCGGYTKSEWCLKELALAKMIRKPVVALLVEPLTAETASALDGLVPPECRLPFHAFVRATRVMDKSVELEIDETALDAEWRDVLPQLKNAMQTPDTRRWLQSASTMSSHHSHSSSRSDRRLDAEPEREHDDEQLDENDDENDESDEMAVGVYSTVARSVFVERLVRDLKRQGFGARPLAPYSERADADVAQHLGRVRVLVVVLESLGFEVSRDERNAIGAELTQLLRVAASVGTPVFPIVARDEFLSFSHLYTLARSDLVYFVSGVGDKPSTTALLRQLRRAADRVDA